MQHLDYETLQQIVIGRVDAVTLSGYEAHLEVCLECFDALMELRKLNHSQTVQPGRAFLNGIFGRAGLGGRVLLELAIRIDKGTLQITGSEGTTLLPATVPSAYATLDNNGRQSAGAFLISGVRCVLTCIRTLDATKIGFSFPSGFPGPDVAIECAKDGIALEEIFPLSQSFFEMAFAPGTYEFNLRIADATAAILRVEIQGL
ncbi:MAG: hypothetical protein HS115_20030 [Spirochaetales bacterium]|nr:hypothetical protein [Spirochaetales bacterium]